MDCGSGSPRARTAEVPDERRAGEHTGVDFERFRAVNPAFVRARSCTAVVPGLGMVTRAEWSPQSRRISCTLGTPTMAPELYAVDAGGGTPRQLTFSEGNKLASQPVTPEKITWSNPRFTIPAYVWKPKNLPPGQRAPVLMQVHGGPTSQFSDNFTLHPQWFASRGCVVIAPNVRFGSGYGRAFEGANNRHKGMGTRATSWPP